MIGEILSVSLSEFLSEISVSMMSTALGLFLYLYRYCTIIDDWDGSGLLIGINISRGGCSAIKVLLITYLLISKMYKKRGLTE
jgi:hypothetical protein